MSGVTAGTVASVAATAGSLASAGASIAGGLSGGGDTAAQAPAGQYIPPSVTRKEANAQNAAVLDAINKAIRKNNKYQKRLERQRHRQARQDIDWFRGQAEKAVEIADPYVKERAAYITKMRALMEDPTSFLEKSPEYRARMAGGLQALTSNLASKGLLGSGNVAIESQALGAREASTQLGKEFDRLAKLSGLDSANLGAAADAMAGGKTPFLGDYRPQFEGERNPMFQGEQGFQIQPGASTAAADLANRQYDDAQLGHGLGLATSAFNQFGPSPPADFGDVTGGHSSTAG